MKHKHFKLGSNYWHDCKGKRILRKLFWIKYKTHEERMAYLNGYIDALKWVKKKV